MERPLGKAEFQPQHRRDLGELVDGGVGPAVLQVRQSAQGHPGEFGQVALPEAEELPPFADLASDLLVRHVIPNESCQQEAHYPAFPDISYPPQEWESSEMRIMMRFSEWSIFLVLRAGGIRSHRLSASLNMALLLF